MSKKERLDKYAGFVARGHTVIEGFCENSLCETEANQRRGKKKLCSTCAQAWDMAVNAHTRKLDALDFILQGVAAGEDVHGPKIAHGLAEARKAVRS